MQPQQIHILIVEDNVQNAELFARILTDYDVLLAHTTTEAIQIAESIPPDLYLIDFDLPDIHGTHLGLSLKRRMLDGELRTAPLIAMTAQNDIESRDNARRCGFDGFLGKPFTLEMLKTLVHRTLNPHPATTPQA